MAAAMTLITVRDIKDRFMGKLPTCSDKPQSDPNVAFFE
jgi:hypothetical protein